MEAIHLSHWANQTMYFKVLPDGATNLVSLRAYSCWVCWFSWLSFLVLDFAVCFGILLCRLILSGRRLFLFFCFLCIQFLGQWFCGYEGPYMWNSAPNLVFQSCGPTVELWSTGLLPDLIEDCVCLLFPSWAGILLKFDLLGKLKATAFSFFYEWVLGVEDSSPWVILFPFPLLSGVILSSAPLESKCRVPPSRKGSGKLSVEFGRAWKFFFCLWFRRPPRFVSLKFSFSIFYFIHFLLCIWMKGVRS